MAFERSHVATELLDIAAFQPAPSDTDGGSKYEEEVRRSPDTIRPMFLQTGVVAHGNGSAYVEAGRTKVVCAVYGPRNLSRRDDSGVLGQLTCQCSFAPFARPRPDGGTAAECAREFSARIYESVSPAVKRDRFPKAVVEVRALVLEDDGSALSAAVTAAALALVDAGVEMYDVVVAATGQLPPEPRAGEEAAGAAVWLDPTHREQCLTDRRAVLAYMPALGQVTCFVHEGRAAGAAVAEMVRALVAACRRYYPAVRACLEKSLAEK